MAFVYWIRAPHHTDMFSEGYIGFTSNTVEERMVTHRSDSVRDKCKNYPVYHAFRKYEDNIVVETLLEGSDEYCLEMEYKLRPLPKIGWNLLCGGQKGSLGAKASDETRAKKSEAVKGDKNHFYGKQHSQESKEKMAQSRRGKKLSPEHCAKLSEARRGKKLNLSPETRAKLSARARSQRMSDSAKAKISANNTGRYLCWNGYRADQELWANADKAYVIYSQEPSVGQRKLSKLVVGRDIQCKSLLKKLREGWNPCEDTAWIEFKEKYEKDQHGT